MHNVLENIDELELNKIDLDSEYKQASKNPNFKGENNFSKDGKFNKNQQDKKTKVLHYF